MTRLRIGGWTAAQRKKLTAIRAPHKSDPKDFYLDAESAWAHLDEMQMKGLSDSGHGSSSWGPMPDKLTAKDEMAREMTLGQWVGISWRTGAGRIFGNEYWNPLMALWVDKEGFDFVFDLAFPNPSTPGKWPFYASDKGSFFAALRRYLYRVDDDAYAAAEARVAPIMDKLFSGADWEGLKTRDYLAHAFSRGTDWAEKLVRGFLDGTVKSSGEMSALVAALTDSDLALKLIENYGGLSDVYYVFDLVESMGADAIPVLNAMTPRGAPDKKRVAAALKVAEKLAAL